MIKIKNKVFFFTLVFVLKTLVPAMAQTSRQSGFGTRINFGPVIGFYSINQKHAIQPTQKMSAMIGFKREFRLDKTYKIFFLTGVDYFFHGLNFRSYYFAKDSIQLYDNSFNYNYSLFVHELNLPLQIKYLFRNENNSLYSPYICLAYHLRYLLPSSLKVSLDGNEVIKEDPELKFRTPFIYSKLNSALTLGVGWQKNSLRSSKGSFFAELNFRYNFSDYIFQTTYSANSLYINSTHLSLILGFKF